MEGLKSRFMTKKFKIWMLFVFRLRGSSRLLDIGDGIIAFTLAELPYLSSYWVDNACSWTNLEQLDVCQTNYSQRTALRPMSPSQRTRVSALYDYSVGILVLYRRKWHSDFINPCKSSDKITRQFLFSCYNWHQVFITNV